MFKEETMKRLLKRGFSPMKVTNIKWSIVYYLIKRRRYKEAYDIMIDYHSCSLCVVARSCYWCPLYAMTGKPHCENTPYREIVDLLEKLVSNNTTTKEKERLGISVESRLKSMLSVFKCVSYYISRIWRYEHFGQSVYYRRGEYHAVEVS